MLSSGEFVEEIKKCSILLDHSFPVSNFSDPEEISLKYNILLVKKKGYPENVE